MELTANHLVQSLEFLKNSISSADNYFSYSKSPIHILVYNEMMRFSKEELESVKVNIWNKNLEGLILSTKNPFLYSVLIKKDAFRDKLSKESQWVLNNCKQKDDFVYQAVFYLEKDYHRERNKESINHETLFGLLASNYIKSETSTQIHLLNTYFDKFWKKEKNRIVDFLVKEGFSKGGDDELSHLLVTKLLHKGVSLENNTQLNYQFLPISSNNPGSNFFISSIDIPRLDKLLKCGFSFNEEEYEYNGKNLFLAIASSDRADIISTILPTIKSVKPALGMTKEKQDQLIEQIVNDKSYKIHSEFSEVIKSKYLSLSLKESLKISDKTEHKVKI